MRRSIHFSDFSILLIYLLHLNYFHLIFHQVANGDFLSTPDPHNSQISSLPVKPVLGLRKAWSTVEQDHAHPDPCVGNFKSAKLAANIHTHTHTHVKEKSTHSRPEMSTTVKYYFSFSVFWIIRNETHKVCCGLYASFCGGPHCLRPPRFPHATCV